MSTRCQIQVEGNPVYLYRHSDGYPGTKNGVVAALKPICEEFLKWRGWDEEYMIAHLCAKLIADYQAHNEETYREPGSYWSTKSEEDLQAHINRGKFLGHGLCTELHGDIEYLYVVTREGIEIRRSEGEPITVVKFGEEIDFDTL